MVVDLVDGTSPVSGSPATATVTTATPVRALVITPQGVKALKDNSPSISAACCCRSAGGSPPHLI